MLQDLVDKALIASVTSPEKVAAMPPVFAQQIPTPLYMSDMFAVVIGGLLPLFMVVSWIYPFAILTKEIVDERERHLQRTMALQGLRGWVYVP